VLSFKQFFKDYLDPAKARWRSNNVIRISEQIKDMDGYPCLFCSEDTGVAMQNGVRTILECSSLHTGVVIAPMCYCKILGAM
jgi:hypothetical protein